MKSAPKTLLAIASVALLLTRTLLASGETKQLHYSSTCNLDTDWNRHKVDVAIKEWIESVKVDREFMPSSSMSIAFYDDNSTRLEFIGNVDAEGFADGPFWVSGGYSEASSFTSGFLYGPLDEEGKMTGKDIVFVFPDMKTVMYGEFRKSVMIAARETRIAAERCRRNIKEIKVRRPRPEAPFLHFEETSEFHFSGSMTIADPYERRTVHIKELPGKGQGIFAKRDIIKGEHIAYYAGFVQNISERPMFFDNQTEEEMFTVHKNLIVLDGDIHMNLPHEFWDIPKFRTTLAHKTNHAFNKTNSVFNSPFHPRFGVIRGVEATKDIRKGEEVLVNYGYGLDSLNPKWYYDAYMDEVGALPENILQRYLEKFGPIPTTHTTTESGGGKGRKEDDVSAAADAVADGGDRGT